MYTYQVYAGVVALSLLGGGLAQDGAGWYAAHPGMARVQRVKQDTHQIVDEFGRARFFHGTNVVMKEPPWHRPAKWVPGVSSFGERDVRNMRDLGLNVVRLGHSWAGAEPVRGEYNETFLDIMRAQTSLAEAHGIYVLVDVHQDVLARQLCGHGVPDVCDPNPDPNPGCIIMHELTARGSGLSTRTGCPPGRGIPSHSSCRPSPSTRPASRRRPRSAAASTGR